MRERRCVARPQPASSIRTLSARSAISRTSSPSCATEIERRGTPPPETEPDAELVDELGDVLFTAVGVAAKLNVDPELALRRTSQKFVERVERAMRLASERGEAWAALDLDGQMRYYDEAKEMLR